VEGILGDTFSVECLLVCPSMVFYGLLVVTESGADLGEHSTRDEGYDVLCESCGLPLALLQHIQKRDTERGTHQDGVDIQPILILHFLYSLFDNLLILRKEHLLLNDNLIRGDIMGSKRDCLDPREVVRVDIDFNARVLELFK